MDRRTGAAFPVDQSVEAASALSTSPLSLHNWGEAVDPISVGTQLLGVLDKLLEMAGKRKDPELSQQIVSLIRLASQLQSENITLQNENLELRKKVDRAEEWRAIKAKLKFEDGAYWLVGDEHKDGPFCPTCADVDEKCVPLHPSPVKAKGTLYCHIHKDVTIYTKEFEPPKLEVRAGGGLASKMRDF